MMALSPRTRRIALGVALAATLGAAAWVDQQEEAAADALEPPAARVAARPPMQPAQSAPTEVITLARLKRDLAPQEMRDLFASHTWYVPPPPPKYVAPPPAAPSLPAPPPAPPPLPFVYLGKLLDDGEITVFVAFNGRNIAVKANEVIESTYRVDAIDPRSMVLTYLPLDMKQTLSLGERN